jgi:hypothetical protein
VHDELIIELNNRVAALEIIKKNRGLNAAGQEVEHG